MTYIMSLDPPQVIELIDLAFEKREEEKAWQMWIAKYTHMDSKSFVPFSEFYRSITVKEINQQPAEEILAEAERIREKARSRKE